MEWRGFAWTGRVSYCAFLLHTIFQRTYIGSQTTTLIMSDYDVVSSDFFLVFLYLEKIIARNKASEKASQILSLDIAYSYITA